MTDKIIYQPNELLRLRHSRRYNIYLPDLIPNSTNRRLTTLSSPLPPIPSTQRPRSHLLPKASSLPSVPLPSYVCVSVTDPSSFPTSNYNNSNNYHTYYVPVIRIDPGMAIPPGGIPLHTLYQQQHKSDQPPPPPPKSLLRGQRESKYTSEAYKNVSQFDPNPKSENDKIRRESYCRDKNAGGGNCDEVENNSLSTSSSDIIIQI